MLRQDIMDLCGLQEPAQRLAEIYSKENLCHHALNNWFSSVDFEALSPQITCMAAAAGKLTRFADVPEEVVPRLRGIIRYVHTLNSGMFSGVWALSAKMNEAGIPLLVTEDTALYMRYPEEPQRHLWQTFVAVRQQDFQQAIRIARDVGFSVEEFLFAAMARKGLTQQILMTSVADTSSGWQNATEIKKGNAVVLSPSPAVILLDISKRIFRSLTKTNPRATLMYWIMDMRVLLSKLQPSDWQQAAQLAAKENVSSHIHMLLSLYVAETGVTVEQKELFADEKTAKRLVRLLKRLRALPDKGCRVRRLILNCRIRRPESLWHTGRLCIKEALLVIRNKLIRKN